ncbi:MAG: exopolysaccharide biosynthesis protein [Cyanobacteria bacterium J083]|nr:MAG: exopolysaccharide biosynthesis protein [Cyanobacteria bacterium J083]
MTRLSVKLEEYFFHSETASEVKLTQILDLAGESIFGFLFVILALPSALPIPAPGYSIPFGAALLVLASQLIFGLDRPWLPQKMLNGSMQLKTVQGFLKAGLPWLKKIEALTRPRFSYVCTSRFGRILIGIAIALMSISMMIPIPGTNTIPAIGIFVTGFGLVEDDGIISLGGLFISAVGAAISLSIFIAVIWGGASLIDVIKGLLVS